MSFSLARTGKVEHLRTDELGVSDWGPFVMSGPGI